MSFISNYYENSTTSPDWGLGKSLAIQEPLIETLPYLSGEDLACCTAVNQMWKGMLNAIHGSLWKRVFYTAFPFSSLELQNDSEYKDLYKRKAYILKNIKADHATKTMLLTLKLSKKPCYLCINQRLIIAHDSQILIYNDSGQLNNRLNFTKSSQDITLFHAEGDLFFCRTGTTVSLWEASTGQSLLTIHLEKENPNPSVIQGKMIFQRFSLDRYRVEIWDIKNRENIEAFDLPEVIHHFHLHESSLICEGVTRVTVHCLETKKSLFQIDIPPELQGVTVGAKPIFTKVLPGKLLLYFQGGPILQIHDITKGALLHQLECGILEADHPFFCFGKLCLTNSTNHVGLAVWDIVKGIKISDFTPPKGYSGLIPCTMALHHDRLIVHYRNLFPDFSLERPVQGYLQVWDLEALTLLLSESLNGTNKTIHFMDDYLLCLKSNIYGKCFSLSETQHLQFWDIRKGSYLNSRISETSWEDPILMDQEHLKGKLLTMKKKGNFDSFHVKVQFTFKDFSIQHQPTSTRQSIKKAALQMMKPLKCLSAPATSS